MTLRTRVHRTSLSLSLYSLFLFVLSLSLPSAQKPAIARFETGSFDAVLDKGGVDAVLTGGKRQARD